MLVKFENELNECLAQNFVVFRNCTTSRKNAIAAIDLSEIAQLVTATSMRGFFERSIQAHFDLSQTVIAPFMNKQLQLRLFLRYPPAESAHFVAHGELRLVQDLFQRLLYVIIAISFIAPIVDIVDDRDVKHLIRVQIDERNFRFRLRISHNWHK